MLLEKQKNNMFRNGIKPSLDEVLLNREKRVLYTKYLLKQYEDGAVLTLKLNIPGEIKNNEIINSVFIKGRDDFESLFLKDFSIIFRKYLNLKTGPEEFIVIKEDPKEIKKAAVDFENSHKLGRIFDIDVLYKKDDEIKAITRTELFYESRRCYICSEEAKTCSSRRIHTVEEMQNKIIEIIKN